MSFIERCSLFGVSSKVPLYLMLQFYDVFSALPSLLPPSPLLLPPSLSPHSPPSPPPPSVNGSDFLAQIGPTSHLVWPANSTRACVSIPIINDGKVENDEIFYVNMVRIVSSPTGAVPRLGQRAIVMIMDDDCESSTRVKIQTYYNYRDRDGSLSIIDVWGYNR